MNTLKHDTNTDALGVDTGNERGTFMSLYSGGKFFPLDPTEQEVHIEDIAHALSHQNRFNGHLKWPYTVAQHSVLCAKQARSMDYDLNVQLYALMHDAAEAYIGDMIRPLKYYMPMFKEVEDRIMTVVARKFDFSMNKRATAKIKTIDNLMCAAEKRDMHPTTLEWPGMPDPVDIKTIEPWPHSYAKGQFMRMFNQINESRRFQKLVDAIV